MAFGFCVACARAVFYCVTPLGFCDRFNIRSIIVSAFQAFAFGANLMDVSDFGDFSDVSDLSDLNDVSDFSELSEQPLVFFYLKQVVHIIGRYSLIPSIT